MYDRLSFGFHNPNHAAALVCALLPLCWGWRRAAWVGRGLAVGLFAALLLTQSRTGLIVAALEWAAWWAMRKGSRMGFRVQRAVFNGRVFMWLGKWAVAALAVGLSLWWLGPRLALDGSILNRPKIWLAGLRLFAANPDGVGLGNSGALVSAFLLPNDVPEVRTLISSHLTLLAECGWLVGWAYLSFLALALCGVRRSSRVGLAFAGLVLSACDSTVFDGSVLFDFAAQGGLGGTNWILSWLTLALFVAFGVWLIVKSAALVGRYGDVTTDSHGLARIEGKRPTVLAERSTTFNTEGTEIGRHGGEQKVVATAVQETGEASPLISPRLSNSATSVLSESNAPVACAAQISIRENPCQSVAKATLRNVSATAASPASGAGTRREGRLTVGFLPSRSVFGIIRITMEEKIKAKLEELRAGLQADGGDLELVKIDGKVVYLKLVGHCGSCPFAMMTLKQGLEVGLQEIDPEITVERVEA